MKKYYNNFIKYIFDLFLFIIIKIKDFFTINYNNIDIYLIEKGDKTILKKKNIHINNFTKLKSSYNNNNNNNIIYILNIIQIIL